MSYGSHLLAIALFLFTANSWGCGEKPNAEEPIDSTPANPSISPVGQRSPSIPDVISSYNADVVYQVLLSALRHNDHFEGVSLDDLWAPDRMVYRKATISPTALYKIEDRAEIPRRLIDSFNAANESPGILSGSYDLYDPASALNGPRNAQEFFVKSKARFPDAKAAVSFSNVGIDLESNAALVYVEYFGSYRGLRKMYLLLTLERYVPDKNDYLITHVDFTKTYRVD